MTWRELKRWARKNGWTEPRAVYFGGFAKVWMHKGLICIEAHNYAHIASAKRALCRAVARILESER